MTRLGTYRDPPRFCKRLWTIGTFLVVLTAWLNVTTADRLIAILFEHKRPMLPADIRRVFLGRQEQNVELALREMVAQGRVVVQPDGSWELAE